MISLFISGSEIFVVFLAILLLFGANKIPEFARALGKGMKEFKKATEDIKREIAESEAGKEIKGEIDAIKKEIDGSTAGIRGEIDGIKNNLNV